MTSASGQAPSHARSCVGRSWWQRRADTRATVLVVVGAVVPDDNAESVARTANSAAPARAAERVRQVVYDPAIVIRLRAAIFRGLRHPVLGPVLILLFGLLLGLLLLHASADQAHDAGLVCLAIVVLLVAIVVPRRLWVRSLRPSSTGQRAPPRVATRSLHVLPTSFVSPPLRL